MASSNRPQRGIIRYNYRALNGGYEDNIPTEDRLPGFTESSTSFSSAFDPVLPSESASQIQLPYTYADPTDPSISSPVYPSVSSPAETYTATSVVSSNISSSQPLSKRSRSIKSTSQWTWEHFEITTIEQPWKNRYNKIVPRDRLIKCKVCKWQTKDSTRHNSIGNMILHLGKHGISPSPISEPVIERQQPFKQRQMTLIPKLSPAEQLEEDITDWIIKDKIPFTIFESSSFRQIFKHIPLPCLSAAMISRRTLKRRLESRFTVERSQLREELASTCRSIALSLDLWTSQNGIPILAVIGHWLTEDFVYKERILEFTELKGIHSGDNIARAVHKVLIELHLEEKLISITGDNASNNEAMVSILEGLLGDSNSLFKGLGSFIRCLAHILNLIVKDILRVLKSGTVQEATRLCDDFEVKSLYPDWLNLITNTSIAKCSSY